MTSATIGGFFYLLLSATGTGLTASCVRWLTIEPLHHATGLRPPAWNFSQLADRTDAYHLLIEIHYKYYQFYGNSVVAVLFAYSAWRLAQPTESAPLGWPELVSLALVIIFFAGSRDSLKRYYQRAGELLEAEKSSPKKRKLRKKKTTPNRSS